jgi:hypothetical protein
VIIALRTRRAAHEDTPLPYALTGILTDANHILADAEHLTIIVSNSET